MNVDVKWLEDIIQKCSEDELEKYLDNFIFVSPNKVAFVKKTVKEGIIPRILL